MMPLFGLVALYLFLWVAFGLAHDKWDAIKRPVGGVEAMAVLETPQSPELVSEGERWMKLTDEGGVSRWLDLRTGRILTQPPETAAPTLDPMMAIVQAALKERCLVYLPYGDVHSLVPCREAEARYTVILTVAESERRFEAWVSFGARIPEATRPAVAEVVARLNDRTAGSLIRVDEGGSDVFVVCGAELAGEPLTRDMVHAVIDVLLKDAGLAHHPVMRVAFGGLSPEDALDEQDIW